MIRLKKFLWCCELETGGQIIGWITLLVNGLLAACCLMVALITYKNCDLFLDKHADKSSQEFLCTREGKKTFIELSLLMGLISIAYIHLGYKCIVGVRKRDIVHLTQLMKAQLFSVAYYGVFCLFSFDDFKFVFIACAVINCYVCIILGSLRDKFKEADKVCTVSIDKLVFKDVCDVLSG